MRIFLALFIALFCLSLLTYRNSLRGEFIREDSVYLLNPEFRVPVNSLWEAFIPRPDDNFYRPLTRVYTSVTYSLFGETILPHRLLNIIFLALAGVLIAFLIRGLTGDFRPALLAALFFCIHPINSTPVLYISMPVIPYAVFFLGSVLCYMRFFEQGRHAGFLMLSGLCFALSFLFHEITLCLPLYIFWYTWQFKGAAWKTALRDTLPFVFIILLYLVLRIAFVHNSLDVISLQEYFTTDPGTAFLNLTTTVIRNIMLYLSKLAYPEGILWNLRVSNQGHASIAWIFLPVIVMAVLGWVFKNNWRCNSILFLFLWFLSGFMMLLATSFVHPSSGIGIEPHWFIASSAGLFGLAGILFFRLRSAGRPDRLWKLILAALILYLGYYANLYCLRWQNEKRYMQYWLSHDASADLPNFWLAQIYHQEGRYPQASQFYCRSLTGGFIDWEVYYNLGIVHHQQGHYDQAIAYFNQAHRLKPDSAAIHRRAAMSYFSKGNVGRAEELLLTALQLAPNSAQTRELLDQIKEHGTPHE